jgi:hypothetical protein
VNPLSISRINIKTKNKKNKFFKRKRVSPSIFFSWKSQPYHCLYTQKITPYIVHHLNKPNDVVFPPLPKLF